MTVIIVEDDVLEGTDNYNDHSVVIASDDSDDGVLLTTGDVNGSISLDVFEEGNGTAVYSTTMAAAAVIDNVPVPWDLDGIGRNFRHKIAQADVGAGVLRGSRNYRMIYRIPTLNDGTLRLVFVWRIIPLEV